MEIKKSYYFNSYGLLPKFLLLIVFCFLAVCCDRKQSKQVFAQNSGKLLLSTSFTKRFHNFY